MHFQIRLRNFSTKLTPGCFTIQLCVDSTTTTATTTTTTATTAQQLKNEDVAALLQLEMKGKNLDFEHLPRINAWL
jgi:hypothetical protein